jgi:hypothetical protein
MIMRYQPFTIAALLTTILLLGGTCFGLTCRPTDTQDESFVTEQEKAQVQNFAKRFVSKLLKARDVTPLINEFFLADFTVFAKQDFYEKVSTNLYSRLTNEERVRLFVAQENLAYVITLDVMTNPDSGSAVESPLKRILPNSLAQKLNRSRLLEGSTEFTDREELLNEVAELEQALLEARPFLKRRNLEQSPIFLRKVRKFERDPYLGYRVRASLIDEAAKLESGLNGFAGRKVFSVETPILLGLVVLRDAKRLRILTLFPADGD